MGSIAASQQALPKILMLHGYAQSAKAFDRKISSVKKACRSVAEMVFIDAPFLIDLPEEWKSLDAQAETEDEMKPRGWWTFDTHADGSQTYSGLDESLIMLAQVLRDQGPFTAVWGFSQGAALAGILASIVQSGGALHPAFQGVQPWDYTIMVAGNMPKDPTCNKFFASPIGGRNIHVVGLADAIVTRDKSEPFVKSFDHARVEYHQGGHHTPSQARWRAFFKDLVSSGGGKYSDVESPEPEALPGSTASQTLTSQE